MFVELTAQLQKAMCCCEPGDPTANDDDPLHDLSASVLECGGPAPLWPSFVSGRPISTIAGIPSRLKRRRAGAHQRGAIVIHVTACSRESGTTGNSATLSLRFSSLNLLAYQFANHVDEVRMRAHGRCPYHLDADFIR